MVHLQDFINKIFHLFALLLCFPIILILYLYPDKSFAQTIDTEHSITINLSLDNSFDAEIEHMVRIKGASNQNLVSGYSINFPFDNIEITSVSINGIRGEYALDNKQLNIKFFNILLKKDETANIKIKYKIFNFVQEKFKHRYIFFTNPTTNLFYNFKINVISKYYELSYINTETQTLEGTISTDLIAAWSLIQKNPIEINYYYEGVKHDNFLPIISENTGINQTVNMISGSSDGYVDNLGNYFLFNLNKDKVAVSTILFQIKERINTYPFIDLDLNLNTSNYIEILNKLKKKFDPDIKLELQNFDYSAIHNKNKLNSLEYAIVTSSALSKVNIPNKIVYGVLEHPKFDKIVHFWVQTEIDKNTINLDPFITKLLGYAGVKADPFRIAFGTIDEKNLDKLPTLDLISNVVISQYEYKINNIPSFDSKMVVIDLDITWDSNIELTAINNSNYFIKISNASNKSIYTQIKNVLFLPNDIANKKLNLYLNMKEVSLDISYQASNLNPINTHLIIQMPNKEEFYLKIGIIIFICVFIIISLTRFLYLHLIRKKKLLYLSLIIKRYLRIYQKKDKI